MDHRLPRLYRDLAEWYPLLTPVGDYAEEAAFYLRLFRSHGCRPPHDRHVMGLFPRAAWLQAIAEAGYRPAAVPFEPGPTCGGAPVVFVGVRPEDTR